MATALGLNKAQHDLETMLADPHAAAVELKRPGRIYGLHDIEVRLTEQDCTILWLTLAPWAPMEALDYPEERVSICVWRNGRVAAVPLRPDDRAWLHRYPTDLGELCLWYPRDPAVLRWTWDDGIHAYITIVHRHLQAEEFWRRHGVWPGEDVPHGEGHHRVRGWALRRLLAESGDRS